MAWRVPYDAPHLTPMSGTFRYSIGGAVLTFSWDGAARTSDGDIILIEGETSAPGVLHVQGHVARAGYMLSQGTPIAKIVWIVRPEHFDALWRIVEPWRVALAQMSVATPPCEYRTPAGDTLALSGAEAK